ncbi:Hypothetical protein R9X50_00437600 [Acrodontium crateriforme]|uniref:Calcineurin-like phosphoesterase domain-containing protein n=1 Tax=Acrodontium crateriforme TaxID=150365 RepID=A0AAQ3RAR7_9PEZI|nr:Hypothetical protein R9X50_00437600 [Acrodontium crateriforme]
MSVEKRLKRLLIGKKTHIQFMSDLHLENTGYDFEIPRNAPYLLLSGDIGRFSDWESYQRFLLVQSVKFDQVLLVAGNHEFYGTSYDAGLRAAKKIADDPRMERKFVFLHRRRFDIPNTNITVLGCTLQSQIDPTCQRRTNDFVRIQGWSIERHNEEHRLDVEWLQRTLSEISKTEPQRKIIVATHYAPAFEKTCHPLHEYNDVSQCFCSHTLKLLSKWDGARQITHWIFGHTHWNAKFNCGPTTILSNQQCNNADALSWWRLRTLYRSFDISAVIKI